jgi:hypothetical protein
MDNLFPKLGKIDKDVAYPRWNWAKSNHKASTFHTLEVINVLLTDVTH